MEQGPAPRLAFEQTLDKLSLCHKACRHTQCTQLGQAGGQTDLSLVTALLITGPDF